MEMKPPSGLKKTNPNKPNLETTPGQKVIRKSGQWFEKSHHIEIPVEKMLKLR